MKYSLGNSNFLEVISSFSFYCFLLFLLTDHLGRLSYLSLLFSGTLHSDGLSFSALPLASLLFLAICKASSDNYFAFLHLFFLVMVLWSCNIATIFLSVPPILSFPLCIYKSVLYVCLYSCSANRFISTIFLDSIYMC